MPLPIDIPALLSGTLVESERIEFKELDEAVAGEVTEQERLESRLAARVILFLTQGEFGKSELAGLLGHKTVSGELHKQAR